MHDGIAIVFVHAIDNEKLHMLNAKRLDLDPTNRLKYILDSWIGQPPIWVRVYGFITTLPLTIYFSYV